VRWDDFVTDDEGDVLTTDVVRWDDLVRDVVRLYRMRDGCKVG
jgi:hypothetical protein